MSGREFRYVEESRHAGTTWSGTMTEEHILCQEDQLKKLMLLMPPDQQCHIEAHGIYRCKQLDFTRP
ncbi:hypothetical protein TNCV_1036431 [Trichonephila clavipes]|nr:hypothetical protein TNCV_1036431 [Trichonephila clavipes]